MSSLHKQLSIILKPLTISPLRLKDSSDFVKHLNSSSDPNYSYYCSLDVKSLYTSCDMRLAAKTVLDKLQEDPTILPDNITVDAVYTLLNFSLHNSYFQYNDQFYKQTTGGPMGSPLTVALAEIRVTETEQLALETSSQPPKHYRYFVDDGFGLFMSPNANEFLRHINGLTNDLHLMDRFLTSTSLYMPTKPPPYIENLPTPTSTLTTPPPHRNPQKTPLSPPSLVELTPYALPVT